MAISAKRFCFQRFMIALLKLSPPGMVTLSPTVRPEMEVSRDSSRYFVPAILMPAMVYSLGGVFGLVRISSSGSTESGCVVSVVALMLSVIEGFVVSVAVFNESVADAFFVESVT